MFKRKVDKKFIEWKDSLKIKKKALIVKGLRQVGKTYSVLHFAKNNYKNVVYINFKDNSSIKSVFDEDLSVDRIILDLSAKLLDAVFEPNETVIIFDEIQECLNARASIKAFMLDGRYDIIATGSLLGIKGYNRKKGKGVPIGFEHIVYMTAMDFEEFLWAKNVKEEVIDIVKNCFRQKVAIDKAIHEAFLRYFKEYICVGGLPYIVDTFLNFGDMNKVYAEQRDLIEGYKDDFGKHLDENENEEINKVLLARINKVFDSIPSQLAKENKKFQYSLLGKKERGSNYEEAIEWLNDYGLINICYNLSLLESPLEGNKINNIFKIYMQDTGLFVSLLDKGTQGEILSNNINIYKGAIFENMIADAFSKMDRKLYYFHTDSDLEIDFITKYENEITLIEVKATTGRTKSANTVLSNYEKYHVKKCIKFGNYNIGVSNNKLVLPYYLMFMLNETE